MHWLRIIAGYAVSVGVGHVAIKPLMEKHIWRRLNASYAHKLETYPVTFSGLVGIVERTLYTTSLAIGAWQFIGVWLAIKVAARWRNPKEQEGVPADNAWLIGTGISLLFGLIGAWIILWHLPSFAKS